VWIERPGRFRWDYQTPYRQLIVADGKQLWTYDEDLEQATVKDLDAALSSTPAMLLSGYRPLSDVMVWEPDTDKDNDQYSWFRLHPKEKDSAVEKVRIGFDVTDARILPDMGIKVSFLEDAPPAAPAAEETPVWTVPAAAVRRDGDADVVLVVRDGKLERRVVSVLRRQNDEVTLADGVAAGERVVVEGGDGLQEGQSVHEE